MKANSAPQVAFDTGGTFTDVVIVGDDGKVRSSKLLCTPDEVARALLELAPAARSRYRHATTVLTNALIEGSGMATVGLITTEGFRDVLEMRSERRPPVYDVNWDRLPPIVPRNRRYEVAERILSDGTIDRPLDAAQVETVVSDLVSDGAECVAVALINSYQHPLHEQAIADVARRSAPELRVCLSSDVCREAGEYERTSTAAVNAALVPLAERYFGGLERELDTTDEELVVMGSHGGFLGTRSARARPAQVIESGPAAGVLAAWRLASELGLGSALCFEMGGTTAKAAVVDEEAPVIKPGLEVGGRSTLASRLFGGEGHAVKLPTLDIAEVGAGGGSIAYVDEGGALKVGPRGAGARPGPACYGLGGEEPTVTDANLVLGYLNPESLAGGNVRVYRERAVAAIEEHVAGRLHVDLHQAALGIIAIADAMMVRALRSVSIERGRDARDLPLVAYGGAGPLHAARLADILGANRVVIPPLPGLFGALGLLQAGYRYDTARGVKVLVEEADPEWIDGVCRELAATLDSTMARDGVASSGSQTTYEADVRYRSGGAVIAVPLPSGRVSGLPSHLASTFRERHESAYGFSMEAPIEIVALRASAVAGESGLRLEDLARESHVANPDRVAYRHVFFGARDGGLETRVIASRLALDTAHAGPLIIEESDTTVLVPPGWQAVLDSGGNVLLTRARA